MIAMTTVSTPRICLLHTNVELFMIAAYSMVLQTSQRIHLADCPHTVLRVVHQRLVQRNQPFIS
eukprot:m.292610 g.292610  ORF g.292610 m.292610 type:complete len:64 (+) comp20004_c1_seq1:126-317(+)